MRFGKFGVCLIHISQKLTVCMGLGLCRCWLIAERRLNHLPVESFVPEHGYSVVEGGCTLSWERKCFGFCLTHCTLLVEQITGINKLLQSIFANEIDDSCCATCYLSMLV